MGSKKNNDKEVIDKYIKIIPKKKYTYKYNIGDIINNKRIINQFYERKNNKLYKFYVVQCTECNDIFIQYENNFSKTPCSTCSHTKRANTIIRKKYPQLYSMILDEDKKKLRIKDKIHWKCRLCNNINYTSLYTLEDAINKGRSLPCIFCSDGFSFGEKIINNVLIQLSNNYETQKTFEWSNGRKYDIYDMIGKKSIFIEINGEQHKYKSFNIKGSRSLTEEIANDKYKKYLVKNNCSNYKYISINAFSKMSFEEIKSNVIRSLSSIYNMDNINWDIVKFNASYSIIYDVCTLYNNGVKVTEISRYKKITKNSVIRYLHKGNEIGICNYIPKNKGIKVKVICLNNNMIFNSVQSAADWCGLKSQHQISFCCKGKERHKTAGYIPKTTERCRWAYYEDYLNDKNKIEYLKTGR